MGPTIEKLDDLAASWSAALLGASWQGGLAIAAAWVLVRCRPALPPRVACWAWRLADLKLIVALLWTTPLLLPMLRPSAPPVPLPATSARVPDLDPVPSGGFEPVTLPSGVFAGSPPAHRPGAVSVVLMFWLIGVVGSAIVAGKGSFAADGLRRSCGPVDDRDVRDTAAELARVLGLGSVPELRAGPAVARPMLVGALRPAILLPAAIIGDPLGMAAIRPILAHELAHVRRRDLLWSGLSGLVRALFFFHPLVWLAHREAHLARESACDALALGASGVRPSEYGRILLDIAAGGPERPARWAATLGMAGPAGSLKRRLMAMKMTRPLTRRRRLSWAFALLAIGAAGIIPWRLVPREALAQEPPPAPPAKESARDDRGGRPSQPAEYLKDQLHLAEARLAVAQAERKVAEALVAQAEAEAGAAVAHREYRVKQLQRISELAKRGAIEHRLVDEEEDRLRESQAVERAAEAKISASRASLGAARASVREAEALRDITRAESQGVPKAGADLKAARARLRQSRLDRAVADRAAARADVDQAEASAKKAEANVEYRTRQTERIRQLVERAAVEQRVLDEEVRALTRARDAERDAKAAVGLARARLRVAETRLKVAEIEASYTDRRPVTPARLAPR